MVRVKGIGIALIIVALMFPCAALCQDTSTEKILKELMPLKEGINKLGEELEKKGQEIEKLKEETIKREDLTSVMEQMEAEEQSKVRFFGDFRLRYENTSYQDEVESRNRGVLRLRAGMSYEINDLLNVGARLATGSADDPNSTDVTLSNFVDNFEVSLDRAYLNLTYQDFFLTGGKFANPFLRTDLVWDDDVNPQGVAASYTLSQFLQVTPKLTGMFFIVDEQSMGSDSYMFGCQPSLKIAASQYWSVTLAAAYYDYTIGSLSNADSGDIRDNNLNPDGTAYLSDFDLLDAIAVVQYRGFGERYPIRFVADYVKNLGAEVSEDQGFSLDLFVGRTSKKNDLRFRYGYSEAETDAVLAAFSHDNTTMATNYRQHTATVDYVVLENTVLNLTWYVYRRDEAQPRYDTPTTDSDEYVSRLRLNVEVKF